MFAHVYEASIATVGAAAAEYNATCDRTCIFISTYRTRFVEFFLHKIIQSRVSVFSELSSKLFGRASNGCSDSVEFMHDVLPIAQVKNDLMFNSLLDVIAHDNARHRHGINRL